MSEKLANAAECWHPSVFISEELAVRGWTLRDLVFRMRRYDSESDWAHNMLAVEMYMAVHDPNLLLGEEMARDLGAAFDVNPRTFLNLHESWRRWKTAQGMSRESRAASEEAGRKEGV